MSEETGTSTQGASAAKKAPAKKAPAKKAPAKKAPAKKAPARERAAAATGVLRSSRKKRGADDGGTPHEKRSRQASSKWYAAKTAPVSKFFHEATERARRIIDDPEKLQQVARDSAASGAVRSGPLSAMLEEFRALVRLVNAYARGHYREISIDSLIFVVAGLLYVVMPIDLIPDAFAGVGFLDDAAVVAWVLKSVRGELDAFKAWELGEESGVAAPA